MPDHAAPDHSAPDHAAPASEPDTTFADVLAGLDQDGRGLSFTGGDREHRIDFAELGALTCDLAARWAGLGVRRGDRVVLVVADEREFALLFLSALRAGVVAVPVYPPYRIGQLESYPADLRRSRAAVAAVCCVVGAALREFVEGALGGVPVHTPQDLAGAPPGPVHAPRPEDAAFLQFSSGSTGTPKAVTISHRALLANARAIRGVLATDGDHDRAVSWLPMYHDMGLVGFLLVPLLDQVPTWYLPPLRFARDPLSWPRLMSEVGASIAFAPNFAYGLVARRAANADLGALDLSRWRVAGCGAEPVHADTLAAFADRFAGAGFRRTAFMPSYGLAESTLAVALTPRDSGVTTLTADAGVLARRGRAAPPTSAGSRVVDLVSCGPPVEGAEVRVVGPAGEPRPDGEEGEIVVRGPSLADGYHGDPEGTARAWRDGWLHTGDHGLLHEGLLYVTGRVKDLIVVNGVNYHPHDIERAASEVPGVRLGNVAALAVRDGDTEGVRLAVATSREVDRDTLATEVRNAVSRRIGLPLRDVVVVRGDLPKTSSGKLRRSRTADLLDEGGLVSGS
ncbi:fatty acyl-AMP ligase [Saccharothrix sp. BKS2]|uniref:fatty acyl-AMP ligase n=1 Tax=Saccharothrix sp. BKS2 TaxID=3064400 RepID=UPI0039E7603C